MSLSREKKEYELIDLVYRIKYNTSSVKVSLYLYAFITTILILLSLGLMQVRSALSLSCRTLFAFEVVVESITTQTSVPRPIETLKRKYSTWWTGKDEALAKDAKTTKGICWEWSRIVLSASIPFIISLAWSATYNASIVQPTAHDISVICTDLRPITM
jgi:hypothetical protein